MFSCGWQWMAFTFSLNTAVPLLNSDLIQYDGIERLPRINYFAEPQLLIRFHLSTSRRWLSTVVRRQYQRTQKPFSRGRAGAEFLPLLVHFDHTGTMSSIFDDLMMDTGNSYSDSISSLIKIFKWEAYYLRSLSSSWHDMIDSTMIFYQYKAAWILYTYGV